MKLQRLLQASIWKVSHLIKFIIVDRQKIIKGTVASKYYFSKNCIQDRYNYTFKYIIEKFKPLFILSNNRTYHYKSHYAKKIGF